MALINLQIFPEPTADMHAEVAATAIELRKAEECG
jgi:hypothetical protein